MAKKNKSQVEETKKEKMIEIQVTQTFGFRGQSYMAGQRYVVAQKELPTVLNGKYEPYKGDKKSGKKNVPVVGK